MKNSILSIDSDCECSEPDHYLQRDESCDSQLQYYRTRQVSSRTVLVPAGTAVRGLIANPYRLAFVISTLEFAANHTLAIRCHDTNTDPAVSGIGGIIGYLWFDAVSGRQLTLPCCDSRFRRIAQANICIINPGGIDISVSITEILAAPGSEPNIEKD